MTAPHLELLSRPGCHLCEEVEGHLAELSGEMAFTLSVVNIDPDDDLVREFGMRIPVLRCGGPAGSGSAAPGAGRVLAEGRLSLADVRRALAAASC